MYEKQLTVRQVLFLAMGVSFGIGSYIEGGVVAGIIILNIIIGFMQEYSAEKTMDSLRSLSSPTSSVIRNGDGIVVPTIEVVPGDMVELKTGGKMRPKRRIMGGMTMLLTSSAQILSRRTFGMHEYVTLRLSFRLTDN